MYEFIFGLISMSIVYSPILFLIICIGLLLLEQWIKYVIEDKSYKLPLMRIYDIFFNWLNNVIDYFLGLLIFILVCVFYIAFVLVSIVEILQPEENYTILLIPYMYSDYIAKPILVITFFVLFTKICKYAYQKYKHISEKIDHLTK